MNSLIPEFGYTAMIPNHWGEASLLHLMMPTILLPGSVVPVVKQHLN